MREKNREWRKKKTVNDHQQEHFKSIKKGINHNCHKNKLFIYALYNISKRIEKKKKKKKMNIKVQLLINDVYIGKFCRKINL